MLEETKLNKPIVQAVFSHIAKVLILVVSFSFLPDSAPATQPDFENIKASAQQQIHAILQDKQSLTGAQRKIDTRLFLEVRRQRRDPSLAQLPAMATGVTRESDGRVLVDFSGEVSEALVEAVAEQGGTVVSRFPRWGSLRAMLPLEAVENLAALPEVRSIRPADAMMVHGSFDFGAAATGATASGNTVITEGDVAHRADSGRATFGVDGSGVTACAISDSVDALGALQASGELPPGVIVLPGQSGNPGTSEGTALLEIIHDLAPGADLAFATGRGGTAQMAQNILDLAAAGCKVITDDVFYFNEPPFQDGILAQAVDEVAADGVLYLSSAGNSGRLNAGTSGVWEGPFVAASAVPAPLVGAALAAHDFGGDQTGNQITEQALNDAPFFTLWWSDPLGAAANDYDLFLLDDALANVVAFSTQVQDGDDDPFEIINSVGIDHGGNRLVVTKFAGEDRFLQVNTHRGLLELATNGQISGHAGAVGAFAVAATNVATSGGGPFVGGATNPAEPFSSDGPRRIFFNADGTSVPAPLDASSSPNPLFGGQNSSVRQKPDFTAADGVSTTTPGFETFFGTSASVPHAAGISALLTQIFRSISRDSAEDFFSSSALDIEADGFDFDSGIGILDGQEALGEAQNIFSDGFESGNTSAWTDSVP